MNWETFGQHIELVIEGEEIIPLVSPLLGGLDLPRRPEKDDYYQGRIYEGMELPVSPLRQPKIVFGRDILCHSCRGTGHQVPMSNGEKSERRRHKLQGLPHARWICKHCLGRGIENVNT